MRLVELKNNEIWLKEIAESRFKFTKLESKIDKFKIISNKIAKRMKKSLKRILASEIKSGEVKAIGSTQVDESLLEGYLRLIDLEIQGIDSDLKQ